MGSYRVLYEDHRRQVLADYIERAPENDNVVMMVELPKGPRVGSGRILDGAIVGGKQAAWEFAEKWAQDNWVSLGTVEKDILRTIAQHQADGASEVHYSLVGDVLRDDAEAKEFLSELSEKGFVTWNGHVTALTRKGQEAVRAIGK